MRELLSNILRPKSIDQVIGQTHLLNKDSLITQMVKNKTLYSLIFYGYPGIGKSSISYALVNDLGVPYQVFNASIDKKEKLIQIIETAKASKGWYVVILEEIHRLNKDKQDILLPYLENGTIYMFASTTENPYFVINPAIRSRCQILELQPVSVDETFNGLKKTFKRYKLDITLPDEILKKICIQTNGDVRSAINIIDVLNFLYKDKKITDKLLKEVMQQSYVVAADYGDEYYDLQSAFHKSMRGSDPDAAIYYLARLLQAGDIESICRRIIACCYEDVGIANPQLCSRVVNAVHAAKEVGFPECKQIFATIVIEICLSQKSNSAYMAIMSALQDVQSGKAYSVPNHIKDQSYKSASKLGRTGYKYPHDFENAWVKQDYLPKEIRNKKYYKPSKYSINEQKLEKYWEELKK